MAMTRICSTLPSASNLKRGRSQSEIRVPSHLVGGDFGPLYALVICQLYLKYRICGTLVNVGLLAVVEACSSLDIAEAQAQASSRREVSTMAPIPGPGPGAGAGSQAVLVSAQWVWLGSPRYSER